MWTATRRRCSPASTPQYQRSSRSVRSISHQLGHYDEPTLDFLAGFRIREKTLDPYPYSGSRLALDI